jgi:hypothetical protein
MHRSGTSSSQAPLHRVPILTEQFVRVVSKRHPALSYHASKIVLSGNVLLRLKQIPHRQQALLRELIKHRRLSPWNSGSDIYLERRRLNMQLRRCTKRNCRRPYLIYQGVEQTGKQATGKLHCPYCGHVEVLWEGEHFSIHPLTGTQEALYEKRFPENFFLGWLLAVSGFKARLKLLGQRRLI